MFVQPNDQALTGWGKELALAAVGFGWIFGASKFSNPKNSTPIVGVPFFSIIAQI